MGTERRLRAGFQEVKGGTTINKEVRVLRNVAFNVGHCGEHERKKYTVTDPKNYSVILC